MMNIPACRKNRPGYSFVIKMLSTTFFTPNKKTRSLSCTQLEPLVLLTSWRRGWDSNPRDSFPPTRFRVERLRPAQPPLRDLIYFNAHVSGIYMMILILFSPLFKKVFHNLRTFISTYSRCNHHGMI